jgi:type I restriction enzyme M protein
VTPLKAVLAIFRRDAGLSGDVQRAAQLAWMLFLKAIDERETEREIVEERYRSPIPDPYRWRNWTAEIARSQGDAALSFVDRELFPALRALPASKDPGVALVRQMAGIAQNLMRSGALLAEAASALNEIDFHHLTTRTALADEFEALLADTRGDTSELFTPASLARLVIELLDPELGETVLDPDFGMGWFLLAAVERLRTHWVRLPEHEADLPRFLRGTEQTALGWMLAVTQLLLRDVVATPAIAHANPIARPLAEIGSEDRADVIAGALPSGRLHDIALLDGFPPAFRATDLAPLHLLLGMQLLQPGGRAALIVPDALLSKQGVTARVRQRLLEDCDLHTIVRLPHGMFSPSTNIRTSILFFTQGRPTREVWYYEHHVPEGLRSYSRRRPVHAEDFEPLRAWWSNRRETDVAFCVPVETLHARDLDLDLPHPRAVVLADTAASDSSPPSRPAHAAFAPEPVAAAKAALVPDVPMRVRALQLRDFRGFSRLDLDFDETAVLIGINGAGKSTVLDAIGLFLSTFAARVAGASPRSFTTPELVESVRVGQEGASAGLTVRVDGVDQYWELRINRLKGKAAWGAEIGRQAAALRERLVSGAAHTVPVLCWYAATRGFGEAASGRQTAAPLPQLQAYDSAFRRGLGPFSDFLRWFRQEEDLENETRLREDPAFRSPALEIVRRAIKQFLGELSAAHFSSMRIERGAPGADAEGALVIDKNGVRLRIEQLSDGEKGTLLLVSDMARRFAVAHAHREDPLQGDGIVLIDEIDRDLHPAWQRAFLPALRATFPSCQIIASTHSPQVLSAVPKEQVIILEDFARVSAPYTYGRDANSILNEAMHLPERPLPIQEQIREIGVLIDAEKLDLAKEAVEKLAAVIGDQDSEVVRLRTWMDFLRD